MSIQKPQNALRRVEELVASGQSEDGLQLLHQSIGHKQFRSLGHDYIQETIMSRYVGLCVELGEMKLVRDGLHTYRQIAYVNNSQSLSKILREFRTKSEAKLDNAKKQLGSVSKSEDISEDLELDETPDSLTRSMFQFTATPTKNTRSLRSNLRMCWDCYKTILDILRTTQKQEKVYHETAQKALEFCLANQRPIEFKRLCEVLRNHYSLLQKSFLQTPAKSDNRAEMETLLKCDLHLDTRIQQLKVATELGLWREAYQTAEDLCFLGINDLLQTPSGRNSYRYIAFFYQKLAEIFWVSEQYNFHALALFKLLSHSRAHLKSQNVDNITKLASITLLSFMSIPYTYSRDVEPETDTQIDFCRKQAWILGHHTVPTRDSLKTGLTSRNVLGLADATTRNLYNLVEKGDFSPTDICARCLPLLQEIELSLNKKYVYPVKKVIFLRMFHHMSKIYTNISIDYLVSRICTEDFLPWKEQEKLIIYAVESKILNLFLDYSVKFINFSEYTSDPDLMIRKQISYFGEELRNIEPLISKRKEKERLENESKFYNSLEENLIKERQRIAERILRVAAVSMVQEEAITRKEEKKKMEERQKQIEDRKAENQKRIVELKKLSDKQKETVDKKKREAAEAILSQLKNISGCAHRLRSVKGDEEEMILGNVNINSISREDILKNKFKKSDFDNILKEVRCLSVQHVSQFRNQQSKKIDYLNKAILIEEKPYIDDVVKEDVSRDEAFINTLLERCESVMPTLDTEHKKYMDMLKSDNEQKIQMEKQSIISDNLKKLKADKIKRAAQRFEENKKRKVEEENQRQMKEENDKKIEEERQRQDKLRKQEEIQKKRQEEINEKHSRNVCPAPEPRNPKIAPNRYGMSKMDVDNWRI